MANAIEPSPPQAGEPVDQRTAMAAERTWLAWWRTALVSTAGALAVGRLAPTVVHAASWPYVVLGVGYGVLAIALLLAGALRQRTMRRSLESGSGGSLGFALVGLFTACGAILAVSTVVLVVAQS